MFVPNCTDLSVTSVEIVDDESNFSDHLPVICRLLYNAVDELDDGSVTSLPCNDRKFYYAYLWSNMAKLDYYYSTGAALQTLINDISIVHEPFEYVNALFDGIR